MNGKCERLTELLHKAKAYTANMMMYSDIDNVIDTSYDELQAEYLIKNGVEVKENDK